MVQVEFRRNEDERKLLGAALNGIGKKKKDGTFTVNALALQKKHHSSIAILKKLRQFKFIKHM